MLTVKVKDNESFEVAFRRFKRAVDRNGLLSEMRMRVAYEKPTTKRKRCKQAAIKRHRRNLRLQSLPLRPAY